MKKITTNGLQNFEEIKKALLKDVHHLNNISNKDTGHLGDIISGLKTTISSINIKVEKLIKEFKEQKS